MRRFFKNLSAAVLLLALTLNLQAFADDISPEEKAEIYILATRGTSENGASAISSAAVVNIQTNMNRYSPLAQSNDASSGFDSYFVTNNTVSTIQVPWEPATFLHRVMAQTNYKNLNTLVNDFENNYLRLRVAAGSYFGRISNDDSGRKNIKIGLSCTKNGGIFATDAKFVQLADYVDLDEMSKNQLTYYDVEIPVKDILESDDFCAFNGSTMTLLDPDAINGVTIAIDIDAPKSSLKIMYWTDLYLAYAPAMPKNISYDVTSDSATLSWDYDKEGLSFNIFRDGEYIDTVEEKSYTDTGLSPDTEYFYQVQAVNGNTASASAEIDAITNTFFSDPSFTEAGFCDVEVNGSSELKWQTASDGDNVITGKLLSESYSGSAVVLAAGYKEGILKDVDIDMISEVTSSGTDFSVCVNSEGIDTIKFFAVDSLTNLKLISQVGVIGFEGFEEKRVTKPEKEVTDFNVNFISDDSGFDISCENAEAYAALALPQEKEPGIITEENASQIIAGVDVYDGKENSQVKMIFDDEKFEDGYYSFYISEAKSNPKEGYFATQETVGSIYTDLNDPNVSPDRVQECLESPVLNLDLTDYNRVSKSKVISMFMSVQNDNIESVEDIKETLDTAVGTVLFCSAVKKSEEDVNKYAELIGLDGDTVKAVKEAADNEVNPYLFKLLEEKSGDVSFENANTIFKNAYICAVASSKNNTWMMLKNIVRGLVDESLISAGIDEADVYKAMLNVNYKEPSDIVRKYETTINELKKIRPSGSPGGSLGSSSGSSAGKTYRVVSNPVTVQTPDTVQEGTVIQNKMFGDLPESHWAYKSVIALKEQNIVSQDVNFRPNDNIKREEFAKMLVMIFEPVSNKKISFADVDENDWFYPYICAAFSGGIIEGISENEFGSGMNISRQDMAKMLYNAIGRKSVAEEDDEEDNEQIEFKDTADISDYALEAITFLSKYGIIAGDDMGNMNPKESATRAECAVMLDRFLNIRNDIR